MYSAVSALQELCAGVHPTVLCLRVLGQLGCSETGSEKLVAGAVLASGEPEGGRHQRRALAPDLEPRARDLLAPAHPPHTRARLDAHGQRHRCCAAAPPTGRQRGQSPSLRVERVWGTTRAQAELPVRTHRSSRSSSSRGG
eukprot:2836862-Rhodomonas_salina.10